jgi:hypothetical protein
MRACSLECSTQSTHFEADKGYQNEINAASVGEVEGR